jgi:hypothetical protein
MTTSTTEEKLKPTRKANVAKRGRQGASSTAKPTTKAIPSKKRSQRAKKAGSTRQGGSKTGQVLDLLKRPGGATLQELMAATGWQPHSVRGFLSGTVRKKMGLAVNSSKGQDGDRTYSVKA